MANKYEIITKREYSAPESVGFVWLKQYTIIKRGTKKFAIIRFFNGFEAPLERIHFTIEQIDSLGSIIEIPENEYSLCVGLDSGISFEKEIPIKEECEAVIINIQKAKAGGKEYYLENGQIKISTEEDPDEANAPANVLIDSAYGEQFWKLFAISTIAAIVILGINLLLAFL